MIPYNVYSFLDFGMPLVLPDFFKLLPGEVLEAICMYITSPKDIKSLCLVSKRVSAIARKLLWRELKFERCYSLKEFKLISKMPIEVLDISDLTLESKRQIFWFNEFAPHKSPSDVASLFKLINRMDYLKHLASRNDNNIPPWKF